MLDKEVSKSFFFRYSSCNKKIARVSLLTVIFLLFKGITFSEDTYFKSLKYIYQEDDKLKDREARITFTKGENLIKDEREPEKAMHSNIPKQSQHGRLRDYLVIDVWGFDPDDLRVSSDFEIDTHSIIKIRLKPTVKLSDLANSQFRVFSIQLIRKGESEQKAHFIRYSTPVVRLMKSWSVESCRAAKDVYRVWWVRPSFIEKKLFAEDQTVAVLFSRETNQSEFQQEMTKDIVSLNMQELDLQDEEMVYSAKDGDQLRIKVYSFQMRLRPAKATFPECEKDGYDSIECIRKRCVEEDLEMDPTSEDEIRFSIRDFGYRVGVKPTYLALGGGFSDTFGSTLYIKYEGPRSKRYWFWQELGTQELVMNYLFPNLTVAAVPKNGDAQDTYGLSWGVPVPLPDPYHKFFHDHVQFFWGFRNLHGKRIFGIVFSIAAVDLFKIRNGSTDSSKRSSATNNKKYSSNLIVKKSQ